MIQAFTEYFLENEYAMRLLYAIIKRTHWKPGMKVDDHFDHLELLLDNYGVHSYKDKWVYLMVTLPNHAQAKIMEKLPTADTHTFDNAHRVFEQLQTSACAHAGVFAHSRPTTAFVQPLTATQQAQSEPKKSLKRDLSEFFPPEGEKCFGCHQIGHRYAQCPNKINGSLTSRNTWSISPRKVWVRIWESSRHRKESLLTLIPILHRADGLLRNHTSALDRAHVVDRQIT